MVNSPCDFYEFSKVLDFIPLLKTRRMCGITFIRHSSNGPADPSILSTVIPRVIDPDQSATLKASTDPASIGINRHFLDNPQIQGNRTTVLPPRELHSFRSHPMA
jgi:hypothetical protein